VAFHEKRARPFRFSAAQILSLVAAMIRDRQSAGSAIVRHARSLLIIGMEYRILTSLALAFAFRGLKKFAG